MHAADARIAAVGLLGPSGRRTTVEGSAGSSFILSHQSYRYVKHSLCTKVSWSNFNRPARIVGQSRVFGNHTSHMSGIQDRPPAAPGMKV